MWHRGDMKNLPYLDGLRGVAVLMVFLIHSGGFGLRSLGHIGNSLVDHGKYGVTVFFVASAYVLTAQMTEKPLSWQAFYIRRLLRIAPMYFLTLAVALAARPWESWPSFSSIVAHFSFANIVMPQYANDILAVEWSIAVEAGFYALFPIFLRIQRRGAFWIVVLATLTALPLSRHLVYEWVGGDLFLYRQYTLPWHAYAFLFGVFAFQARDLHMPHGVLTAALIVIGLTVIAGEGQWSGPASALAAALVIHDAHNGGASSRILSSSLLTFVGKISFSIYLTHMLLIAAIGPILALPAALALSYVTWLYVEEPFRRFARLARN